MASIDNSEAGQMPDASKNRIRELVFRGRSDSVFRAVVILFTSATYFIELDGGVHPA